MADACEGVARLFEVHVGKACVVGAPGGDHHVVDRSRETLEELGEGNRIVGVERRGAQRAELAGRVLQPRGNYGRRG